MKDNCIFCKIVEDLIPSNVVFEDETCKVILDIAPAAKGHLVIILKKHVSNVYELADEDASKVFLTAAKAARALKDELKCDGVNILQNNEPAAGQTVFHFHMHVIPRYQDDKVNLGWKTGEYKENEMTEMAERIRRNF